MARRKYLDEDGLAYFWGKIKDWVNGLLTGKQDTLQSGVNIKTVNNESLLGSGNINIQGGGSADAVLYTEQSLTGEQQAQARVNIGAGTYSKPSGGIPSSDIASGVIPDVSTFITKSVNDLTNYYLKSETYTQAEVAALIGAIQQFHYEIYPTLPQIGQSNVLYLIGPTGSGSDRYEEYVYANNAFTKIGDTSIDLSGYVTTSALNTALADYTTTAILTTLLAGKQDTISDLATIRSGADLGATAYQKPLTGIPAQDLARGVIPDISGKEDTSNKVSTISGNETNTTKYPNTKAVADALGKWGVVSQTISWSDSNQNATYTLSNITNGLIPLWVIEQAAVYGVIFNETSGYFEYCGYTDIAADEMKKVLGRRIGCLVANCYAGYELRILLPGSKGPSNQQSLFQSANKLREIPAFYGQKINIGGYSFNSCWLLKRINLELDGNSSTLSTDYLFGNCSSLEYVNINGLKVNFSIKNSPNLTIACMVDTVTRAANTSAVTITLHANAYARCQADTTEYTYGGNTYTGILALATAHDITIASAS